MKIALTFLLLAALLILLFRGQQRLIYHPRPYAGNEPPRPARLVELIYDLPGQGRQTAFYLPPRHSPAAGSPRLWLLFGGNGSLALDWLDLVEGYPDQEAAFLLLEYPGYGRCQGRANPAAILASAEAGMAALASRLHLPAADPNLDPAVLGHSLGTAAGLLYASRHPVRRLVLISPFTSLREMAVRVVGRPLSWTLLQNYDNRARLREVSRRQPAIPITIIHGNHDKVVPVTMGRELATLSPSIRYEEIDRGDHNFLLVTAAAEIYRAMLSQPAPAGAVK